VAVSSKAISVSSRLVAEAAARLHLEEVVGKAVAVVLVVALAEVLQDMEKDQMMMEEERGRLL
jgi:hypothetical protein